MRIIYRIIASFLFLAGFVFQGWSQTNNSLYFMRGIPQVNRINPARQPECGFYLGFPGIAPVSVDALSRPLAFEDLIYPHPTEDSLITFLHPLGDKQAFLDKLKPVNVVLSNFGTSLLSFGFRTGVGFFSLDVTSRVEWDLSIPGDLPRMLLEGADEGRTYSLDGIGTNLSGFDEIALGWSGTIGNRWQIGARGKLLFGLGNVTTSHSELSVSTSQEVWNLSSDMLMNTSLPFADVIYDDEGMIEDVKIRDDIQDMSPMEFFREAFNTGNFGLGIDLGVDFRPTDRWLLSASILDLGYIRWSDEVHQVRFNTVYDYDGLEVNPLEFTGDLSFDEYLDSSITALGDSLAGALEFSPGGIYSRRLNTKVYVGAAWDATPNINFGLLSRTDFLKESILEQLTASANFSAGRMLNFSLSYSFLNSYYKNFGIGLSLTAGPCNLYLVSNNALNVVLWPQEANSANLWFGMNLIFGYEQFTKVDRDRPLVY